ncbi:excalibur calcium-binding domain-containing protein [Aerococcaceae bacterium WGS1372]
MRKFWSGLLVSVITLGIIMPTAISAKITEELLGYKILAESQNKGELVTVKDFNVIDGDTADFILDRKEDPSIKARFLLIDAPELRGNEPYAKESKNRVRELLQSADLIQIEYEGAKKDKYERDLVHVWVDGILLQEILVSEGYAIARYIKGYLPNSEYVQTIYDSQDYAARNGFKVWTGKDPDYLAKAEGLTATVSYANAASEAEEVVEHLAADTGAVGFTENITYEDAVTEEPVYYYEETPAASVYYENCTAVRAAGAAPIYPGDPGFQSKFDRDNDGIGCE